MGSTTNLNGLSSPALADLNGDYIVDRIYAGDLHGNLWAFDLDSANPMSWHVDYAGDPFFQACINDDCSDPAKYQPITTKPVVSRHPYKTDSSTAPNVMVYFGTGQYLAVGDESKTDLQAFYAVWDTNATNPVTSSNGKFKKSNLVQQSFNADFTITSNSINYGTALGEHFGWYVNLEVGGGGAGNLLFGGRSVITPVLLGDIVFFIVTVPDSGPCAVSSTKSYLATLSTYDGTQVSGFNVYASGSPALQLLSQEAVGLGTIGNKIVTTNSDGSISDNDVQTLPPKPAGRSSWSIFR